MSKYGFLSSIAATMAGAAGCLHKIQVMEKASSPVPAKIQALKDEVLPMFDVMKPLRSAISNPPSGHWDRNAPGNEFFGDILQGCVKTFREINLILDSLSEGDKPHANIAKPTNYSKRNAEIEKLRNRLGSYKTTLSISAQVLAGTDTEEVCTSIERVLSQLAPDPGENPEESDIPPSLLREDAAQRQIIQRYLKSAASSIKQNPSKSAASSPTMMISSPSESDSSADEAETDLAIMPRRGYLSKLARSAVINQTQLPSLSSLRRRSGLDDDLYTGSAETGVGGLVSGALRVAADNGHKDMVEILLSSGADVNATGGIAGTALQAAAHSGHLEIVELLLSNGADLSAENGHWGSPLIAACFEGHLGIVKVLHSQGADVNARVGRMTGTPIHAAAWGGHVEVVEYLISVGADLELECGHYGTALIAAAYNGKLEVVRLLVEKGANVNITVDNVAGTPLHAAVEQDKKEVVEYLLSQGAKVNARGGIYGNAINAAARNNNLSLLTMLIAQAKKQELN